MGTLCLSAEMAETLSRCSTFRNHVSSLSCVPCRLWSNFTSIGTARMRWSSEEQHSSNMTRDSEGHSSIDHDTLGELSALFRKSHVLGFATMRIPQPCDFGSRNLTRSASLACPLAFSLPRQQRTFRPPFFRLTSRSSRPSTINSHSCFLKAMLYAE